MSITVSVACHNGCEFEELLFHSVRNRSTLYLLYLMLNLRSHIINILKYQTYLWHGLDVPLMYGGISASLSVDGQTAGKTLWLEDGHGDGALLVPSAEKLWW